MSTSDVPPDEMGTDPNATEDALERMLSGQEPAADEWRELDGFVQDLHEAVPARPLASEDLHVAAMVETAHLIADKGDPVVRPVSNADAPARQVSWLPKLRRKQMKRSTRTLVRVLAPLAAVLTVMGSMAVSGALPHTVQKAVSHAAGTVGLNLPGDDDQGDNSDDQGDNNNQGEDTQGDTQTGDQTGDTSGDTQTGDQAGDQGDNSQGDNNNQGEDTQGDTQSSDSSGDQSGDQGDNSQGDNNNQGEDTQSGDSSGDPQSGDSQGDNTSSGDSSGDSSSGDSQGGDSQN
jgi:hypothetical protein